MVVRVEHVEALLNVLKARDYRVVAGSPPFGFVGKDCEGRVVDVTPITFADDGSACYRGPNRVERSYGPNAFTAYGTIHGTVVRCLTPAAQMDAHVGYAFDQKDVNEVWLLHDRFGVPIPDEYAHTRPTA